MQIANCYQQRRIFYHWRCWIASNSTQEENLSLSSPENKACGHGHHLIPELLYEANDRRFRNFTRLTRRQFFEVLRLVGPIVVHRQPPVAQASRLRAEVEHLASWQHMDDAHKIGQAGVIVDLVAKNSPRCRDRWKWGWHRKLQLFQILTIDPVAGQKQKR